MDRPAWDDVRRDDGGALLRVWFRRLYSEVWGALLRPTWFHTWVEVLARDGAPWHDRPLAVGVYDKMVASQSRAVLMHQGWEHEPEQLERFDPGYVLVDVPRFTDAQLDLVNRLCFDGERLDLGPYAFLAAWGPYLAPDESRNCMTWVEEFIVAAGGRRDVLKRVERGFRERLTLPESRDRRH